MSPVCQWWAHHLQKKGSLCIFNGILEWLNLQSEAYTNLVSNELLSSFHALPLPSLRLSFTISTVGFRLMDGAFSDNNFKYAQNEEDSWFCGFKIITTVYIIAVQKEKRIFHSGKQSSSNT